MQRYTPLFVLAGLLAGCAPDQPDAPAEARPSAPAAAPAATPTVVAAPGRTWQHTRLDKCRVVEVNDEEGGWSVEACPGLGGYRLRLTEGDLRQNIVVELPGGGERSLKLSEVTKSGGFTHMGETVEWRGQGEGGAFRPDALILRYAVVEDSEQPERPTSYLLTVSLANQRPCVTAKIPPGPGQNDRARQIADGPMRCLDGVPG